MGDRSERGGKGRKKLEEQDAEHLHIYTCKNKCKDSQNRIEQNATTLNNYSLGLDIFSTTNKDLERGII